LISVQDIFTPRWSWPTWSGPNSSK